MTRAELNIDSKRLDFDLGGGFLANFIDIFMPLFDGKIRRSIEKDVESLLMKELPISLNQRFQKQNGYLKLAGKGAFENLTLDYSFEENPKENGTYIGAGMNGTFFNEGKYYYVPSSKQVDMPFHNYNVRSRVQVFLSDYFLESMTHSIFEDFNLQFRVNSDEVPSNFPI